MYFDKFDADLPDVLARMGEAGVAGAIVIGIDDASNRQAYKLARAYANLAFTVGLHPTSEFSAEVTSGSFDAKAYLGDWLNRTPRPVGIGECGIDLHWDTNALAAQVAVFRAQLELARELDLPVVVHTRDADQETLEVLESVPGARGVLHCFNGSPALLDFALKSPRQGGGWYISFAGNLTFPKAAELRDSAKQVPLERLLVETDAPFLAPQAVRGKRNEPSFVVHTTEFLADLRGIGLDELSAILRQNSEACFGNLWN